MHVDLPDAAPLHNLPPAPSDAPQRPASTTQLSHVPPQLAACGAELWCPYDKQAGARLEQVAAKRTKASH